MISRVFETRRSLSLKDPSLFHIKFFILTQKTAPIVKTRLISRRDSDSARNQIRKNRRRANVSVLKFAQKVFEFLDVFK